MGFLFRGHVESRQAFLRGRGIKNKLAQPAWFSNFTWGNEGTFALANESWFFQHEAGASRQRGDLSEQ
ncbi:hypothetical protein BTO09_08700 [Gilvibacter sp. SZ-19]|nr:hypothetical protein BTO09_08700 [Gilvibacter sp. SZ-19]